jgi:SAM-dependent methyltransferase
MIERESLPVGAATMSPAMAQMNAYPRYLFHQVLPVLGTRVWEIGIGYGFYSRMLLALEKQVLATDVDPECIAQLQNSLGERSSIQYLRVDLCDRDSVFQASAFEADSVLCFNVLEHIQQDVSALQWIRESVRPKATLGLIVPAHQGLFGKMDSQAGHFRRYSCNSLRTALVEAGWKVDRIRYINAVGACGWWFHNRVRKTAGLQDRHVNQQMSAMDRWLPRFARLSDPWMGRLFGLSVVAWGRCG